MPIRNKFATVSGSLILIMAVINFYILANVFTYLGLYQEDHQKTSDLYALQKSIDQSYRSFEIYLQGGEGADLEQFRDVSVGIWDLWNRVNQARGNSLRTRFEITAVRYGWLAFNKSAEHSIIAGSNDPGSDEFVQALLRTRRIYGYVQQYLANLIDYRLSDSSSLQREQIARARQIQFVSFLSMFGITLLFIVLILRFAENISRPLRLLAERSARIAHGDLTTPDISIVYLDEMGSLNRSFNEMNRRLHAMVESLKEKAEIELRLMEDERTILEMQSSLKEARLQSLQSQISPHFFFNSMNIINRTALLEKAPDTARLVEALAGLFRYTLSNSGDLVPLSRELHILDEYMYIQKIRYGERLTGSIEVDPGIRTEEVEVPFLSIQPLVENAIQYAVETRENGGRVEVRVTRDSGAGIIEISIADDGGGIPEAVLQSVIGEKSSSAVPEVEGCPDSGENHSSRTPGIGLRNVKQRLEMHFGESSRFSISCPETGGTRIILGIPESAHV